ncbi:peroxiredoxin [Rubellimicrobium mesophilum]|nr:peroxiredoxin [Rubellimicrobium mesophilum]
MTVAPGQPAPTFTLPRDGGGTVSLADLRGRHVVLFFYPKDDTAACTLEAQEFTGLQPRFEAAGAAVLGVSTGTVAAKGRFVRKAGLGIPLLADEKGETLRDYGVWQEKTMFGRAYMGIVRTTVLIDPVGDVAQVWTVRKAEGHAQEVLGHFERIAGSAHAG